MAVRTNDHNENGGGNASAICFRAFGTIIFRISVRRYVMRKM